MEPCFLRVGTAHGRDAGCRYVVCPEGTPLDLPAPGDGVSLIEWARHRGWARSRTAPYRSPNGNVFEVEDLRINLGTVPVSTVSDLQREWAEHHAAMHVEPGEAMWAQTLYRVLMRSGGASEAQQRRQRAAASEMVSNTQLVSVDQAWIDRLSSLVEEPGGHPGYDADLYREQMTAMTLLAQQDRRSVLAVPGAGEILKTQRFHVTGTAYFAPLQPLQLRPETPTSPEDAEQRHLAQQPVGPFQYPA